MYTLSKFIWFFLNPLNFLIFFLLLAFFLRLLKKNNISNIFFIFSLLFFTVVGVFPTGNFLLFKLEKNYPSLLEVPYNLDGILILGGPSSSGLTSNHNQVNFNDGGERLTESTFIIKKYQPKKIIFSGGSVHQSFENSHAYVAKIFFSQMGIDVAKIDFEYKSRNTFENLVYSFEIANPKKYENWLLITSSFHMTRAINIAEKLGWNFTPYPVDFKVKKKFHSYKPSMHILNNFNAFNLASHEYIGLISYYFLGRTDKIL
tara:strand:- start:419 stop:1198 length:780 start_codon:yes stop_codon:yes gene_type:complete